MIFLTEGISVLYASQVKNYLLKINLLTPCIEPDIEVQRHKIFQNLLLFLALLVTIITHIHQQIHNLGKISIIYTLITWTISLVSAIIRHPQGYFNLLTPSSFFTYHQGLTFKNSTWCSLCVECFVRISEQTATFALYSINWLVFITEMKSVYCAVRTGSLNKAVCASYLKG